MEMKLGTHDTRREPDDDDDDDDEVDGDYDDYDLAGANARARNYAIIWLALPAIIGVATFVALVTCG